MARILSELFQIKYSKIPMISHWREFANDKIFYKLIESINNKHPIDKPQMKSALFSYEKVLFFHWIKCWAARWKEP